MTRSQEGKRPQPDEPTAARPSGSRRVAPYIELRTLLLRYLSPILVDTVLNQAMFKRGLTPQSLGPKEIHDLAPDVMLGLRLFVAEKRLPELMMALADVLDRGDS